MDFTPSKHSNNNFIISTIINRIIGVSVIIVINRRGEYYIRLHSSIKVIIVIVVGIVVCIYI